MQNIQCHLLRKQRGHILVKRFCANLVILTGFVGIRIDSYDTVHRGRCVARRVYRSTDVKLHFPFFPSNRRILLAFRCKRISQLWLTDEERNGRKPRTSVSHRVFYRSFVIFRFDSIRNQKMYRTQRWRKIAPSRETRLKRRRIVTVGIRRPSYREARFSINSSSFRVGKAWYSLVFP